MAGNSTQIAFIYIIKLVIIAYEQY